MNQRSVKVDDSLEDFTSRKISLNGVEKKVYVAGTGPAVIVMTEMPGISPHVARFSRWVREVGFTVYMPSLFGRDGAIGMCFTGNFALSMMLESSVLAPVLAQTSLPLGDSGGLEIAKEELQTVRERLEQEELTVLAYRFKGDQFCKAERFAAYQEALGERFIARELPDSAANPDVPPFHENFVSSPHSVVTAHLIDEAGQPTTAAGDEILDFSNLITLHKLIDALIIDSFALPVVLRRHNIPPKNIYVNV